MNDKAAPASPARRAWTRDGTWTRHLWTALLVLGLAVMVGVLDAWSAVGTLPSGARQARIEGSPHFQDGKFVDDIPRVEPDVWAAFMRWVEGVEHSAPTGPLPVLFRTSSDFAQPRPELQITWFGHSTLLVEIEGRRVLLDPVFSERCSPSRFIGPKRFHPVPLPVTEVPPVDAVVISHDHYDHLDYMSIMKLRHERTTFVVPLGVGAHLEYWGIPAARIRELDWWEHTDIAGLRLVATPARHFSGRGLGEDKTLWAGWAILGERRRVFYSGDTAMFDGFEEIGARLGPFDATLIESGAYNALWADVHLGPEQAVLAHRAVRGKVLFPVHWGTFNLALHSWVEPAERVLAAAKAAGVTVVTPRPGESIDPLAPPPPVAWWPQVPWQNAADAPVTSSGLKARH